MINSHEATHGQSTCHFGPGVRCVSNTPCDITKQPSKINNSRKISELALGWLQRSCFRKALAGQKWNSVCRSTGRYCSSGSKIGTCCGIQTVQFILIPQQGLSYINQKRHGKKSTQIFCSKSREKRKFWSGRNNNIATFMRDYRRGLDWWIDLLTT
jgi:hypothetical protein